MTMATVPQNAWPPCTDPACWYCQAQRIQGHRPARSQTSGTKLLRDSCTQHAISHQRLAHMEAVVSGSGGEAAVRHLLLTDPLAHALFTIGRQVERRQPKLRERDGASGVHPWTNTGVEQMQADLNG